MTLKAAFISHGRKAQSPPNPAYPNGVRIDLTTGQEQTCSIPLRYPAECVGKWEITCTNCGYSAVVTAAGRPDDPRSVKVPCKLRQAS